MNFNFPLLEKLFDTVFGEELEEVFNDNFVGTHGESLSRLISGFMGHPCALAGEGHTYL
jgi:hypothetical protein